MATPRAANGVAPPWAAGRWMRVTRVALVLNALAHGSASLGFAFGFVPHALDGPIMAHRAAAAGFAAVFMLIFVASRLRRDPSSIVLALAFVFCNFADSGYELSVSHDPNNLPPLIAESTFLAIYAVFLASVLRARRATPSG